MICRLSLFTAPSQSPSSLSNTVPLRLVTIKGAPDVIINRCTQYITDAGLVVPLDEQTKAAFEQAKNRYSSQGKRCILLARKVVRKGQHTCGDPASADYEKAILDHSTSGLTLVGLVAIVDPLRSDIIEVVSTLRGAGVRIAVVCDSHTQNVNQSRCSCFLTRHVTIR